MPYRAWGPWPRPWAWPTPSPPQAHLHPGGEEPPCPTSLKEAPRGALIHLEAGVLSPGRGRRPRRGASRSCATAAPSGGAARHRQRGSPHVTPGGRRLSLVRSGRARAAEALACSRPAYAQAKGRDRHSRPDPAPPCAGGRDAWACRRPRAAAALAEECDARSAACRSRRGVGRFSDAAPNCSAAAASRRRLEPGRGSGGAMLEIISSTTAPSAGRPAPVAASRHRGDRAALQPLVRWLLDPARRRTVGHRAGLGGGVRSRRAQDRGAHARTTGPPARRG